MPICGFASRWRPSASRPSSRPGNTIQTLPDFNRELYKARHLIENFFRKLK